MRRVSRALRFVVPALSLVLVTSSSASAAPGDVDGTFASAGLLTQGHAITNRVPIVPGPGGRFVLAWSTATDVGVSGFLGGGTADGGYGAGGSSTITVPGATLVETDDASVDGQGRTLVVGFASFPGTVKMFVARFTAEGDPDTTLSGDGVQVIGFAKGESYAYDVVARKGGIYLVGQVYPSGSVADVAVVRLDAAGELDPAFGKGGRKVYDVDGGFAGDDFAVAIEPVANGRFVLAGGVDRTQGADTLVMRIEADGRLDRSFKDHGVLTLDLRKGGVDSASDLAVDGKKLVLSVTGDDQKPKIARLRPDGSRDLTFGTKGIGRYPMAYFLPVSIAVDAEHRVLVVGYNSHLPVLRTRANGSASTFGVDGVATNVATNAAGFDVMLQGELVVVSGGVNGASIHATRYVPN